MTFWESGFIVATALVITVVEATVVALVWTAVSYLLGKPSSEHLDIVARTAFGVCAGLHLYRNHRIAHRAYLKTKAEYRGSSR